MSQDELVDIVNEKGEILKTVSKKEAHEEGLLHKTVIGEVVNSQNQWLMVKQSSTRQDAGQYVSPVGGHVTSGENEEQALVREAFEELGLQGNLKYERIGREIFNREILGRKENHYFIMFKVYSDEQPILNEESESFKYFTEEELKNELKSHPDHFGNAFHFCVNKFFPNLL